MLLIDQGLSSASNFAIAAAAGQRLDADGFGRFAIVLLAISTVVNLGRAVWHEPDLVDANHSTRRTLPPPNPLALGSLTLVAVAAARTLDTTRWGSSTLIIAGLALIVAVANDRARYRAIAAGASTVLLAAEGLWLAVVLLGLSGTLALDTPAALLQLWLLGAAFGTCILIAPRDRLRNDSPTAPLTSRPASGVAAQPVARRLALLADFALFAGMTQLGGLLVAMFLPFDEIATLRGAIVIFGPVGVATGALATWIFASLATEQIGEPDAVRRIARASAMVAGLGIATVAVAAVLPAGVGLAVLGSAWPPRSVLVLIGIAVACQALSTPAMMLLRARDERRPLLTLRAGAFAVFLASTIGFSILAGTASAAAVGYLLTNAGFAAAVWWWLLAHLSPPPAQRKR
ncbi:MAG: hypothetical protein ACR2QO_10990 [Acidimicrobiales bacterium]